MHLKIFYRMLKILTTKYTYQILRMDYYLY